MLKLRTQWLRILLCAAACGVIPACQNQNSSNLSGPSFSGVMSVDASVAGQVTLTWTPALEVGGGTIHYNIFALIGGPGNLDFTGAPVYTTTTNSTGMTFSIPANPYMFSVQAVDAAGNPDTNSPEPQLYGLVK